MFTDAQRHIAAKLFASFIPGQKPLDSKIFFPEADESFHSTFRQKSAHSDSPAISFDDEAFIDRLADKMQAPWSEDNPNGFWFSGKNLNLNATSLMLGGIQYNKHWAEGIDVTLTEHGQIFVEIDKYQENWSIAELIYPGRPELPPHKDLTEEMFS